MPDRADIEHLLRRTEFVARPARVAELMGLPSIEAAVDNILDVPTNPGSVTFQATEQWYQMEDLTHFWFDRMAHDSPRPMQEKMAFFWHGHFCTAYQKAGSSHLMREQIDLFRHQTLGNFRTIAIEMSTQVAMLRYLDNNKNYKSSPNQNFARELMELFLLGVGNYTEADVEAATAAWTGHTDFWEDDSYVWENDEHQYGTKSFLGRTINAGADGKTHGADTIRTILGDGVVPAGAPAASNRGRPTQAVAAEFLSKKLWIEFAGTDPSAAVVGALRDAALAADFDIGPWLRTLLTRPEFYQADVKRGLVRSPVEFVVAALVATGLRSRVGAPLWLMEGMGQRPLFPPNVSGWKHNGYWISASAMAQRTRVARSVMWKTMEGYWDGGEIRLAGGSLTKTEIDVDYRDRPTALVDRFLELMRIDLSPGSLAALHAYSKSGRYWERTDLTSLIFMSPDFHVA